MLGRDEDYEAITSPYKVKCIQYLCVYSAIYKIYRRFVSLLEHL